MCLFLVSKVGMEMKWLSLSPVYDFLWRKGTLIKMRFFESVYYPSFLCLPRENTAPTPSSALVKLRCMAFWPRVSDLILLEQSLHAWGLQLSRSLLWLNRGRRQISKEMRIPWKILRWGRLYLSEHKVILECKESPWVDVHGSLSLTCALKIWNTNIWTKE